MKATPWILGVLLLSACQGPRAGTLSTEKTSTCELDVQPEVISVKEPKPGELNELFDLPDSPAWWAPAPMDPEREQYRTALVARLGEEGLRQRTLLERQRDIHLALVGKPMRRE